MMKEQKKKSRQNILDRAITWISPELGRRRYQERALLEFMQKRNYSAGDRGRRTDGWASRSSQSVNTMISKSLPLIRERSRDLVRNNPWGASMRSEIVSNLIHYGIIASFTNTDTGAGEKSLDEDVPKIWLDWAESPECDAVGRKNIYEIQKLVAGTWFESGECFIRRVWRDDWKPGEIPFALQILEPEFIDNSHDGRDNTKLGIKFDSNGRRIGYWVFKKHPGEAVSNESFFVDDADMIHVYSEDRPGQIRGIPMMAPSVIRMYDLDLFEQAELTKQEIASMFAAFEKDADPYNAEASAGEEKNGITIDDIQPGAIQRLPPGRDMVFSNPPQRGGYAEYVRQNLFAIAAGVGLTYENVTGDYGRVTFLNGRMGQLRFHRKIDQWLWMMMIPQFCDRVARWFLEGAAIAGKDMTGYVIEWQPPVKQMVDPMTEANAEEKLVRMGAKTQYEMIRGQGHDPIRFLKQRKKEQDTMDEMGIVFTTDVRKVSGAGQFQPMAESAATGSGNDDENSADSTNTGNSKQKDAAMEKDVQQTALNGAQSQALQSIVEGVAGGGFPKETGKTMVKLAFPMSSDDQVDGIFDPIVVKETQDSEDDSAEK